MHRTASVISILGSRRACSRSHGRLNRATNWRTWRWSGCTRSVGGLRRTSADRCVSRVVGARRLLGMTASVGFGSRPGNISSICRSSWPCCGSTEFAYGCAVLARRATCSIKTRTKWLPSRLTGRSGAACHDIPHVAFENSTRSSGRLGPAGSGPGGVGGVGGKAAVRSLVAGGPVGRCAGAPHAAGVAPAGRGAPRSPPPRSAAQRGPRGAVNAAGRDPPVGRRRVDPEGRPGA